MHRLLTEMPLERLAAVYRSLEPQIQRALDTPIARALNSRPATVARRPEDLRMRALRSYLLKTRDDDVAGDLLRAYLLGPRKDLVIAFLDATGVAHEEGQVEGDGEPDKEKVPGAVKALLEAHERDDVELYLRIAALQWPENEAVAAALDGLSQPA